jgi:hypothetical protein
VQRKFIIKAMIEKEKSEINIKLNKVILANRARNKV